ncbi:DNA polymerase delta, subunit 4-domain-containing protein [Neohortaea acidophila]|uniref:DNA polymerase delta, subunit 4-domain-containing protein n=1 Tax=Neohortaea acidophila TaxID=245834 RepID=A0A6A6PSH4_9PEZI|nr:DNA polymerase delta, subunit 4-domain-containing protein [Neohortaea acidophila]KAF2482932.1 DNA polymerase delta, subunit 4-domain-containing protein [Neohortaea acidophila]
MAPKRRSQTAARRTTSAQQQRLSFQSKVTKPSSAQQAKTSKKDPALIDDIARAELPTADAKEEAPQAEEDVAADPLSTTSPAVTTADEASARKIKDSQIKAYWRAKEQERKAPRVHQQDLTVYEKVLREWDMSGQYGPCIGIARLKRWKRANLLGLKPPVEVLAVLLKQLDEGNEKAQTAHVDELMTSRFTTET